MMSLVENLRQVSVGKLFSEHSNFNIPKYQRGYAWKIEQVEDFCADILKCLNYRRVHSDDKKSETFEHFFGGIVCIESKVTGSSRTKYDVIDGQQRVATFSMLANCLIEAYEEVCNDVEDDGFKDLVNGRINDLKNKYRFCEDEINKRREKLDKLTLSVSDAEFFKKETLGQSPAALRESNNRIKAAMDFLRKFVKKNISSDNDTKIDDLKRFEEVLNDNCTLIQITTFRAKDAYKLFQVLNDRGLSLSEGDLLRAKTLELLESPDFEEIQNEVGLLWDEILRDDPVNVKSYLSWYFSGVVGRNPKSTEVFDEYLRYVFDLVDDSVLSYENAVKIKNITMDLKLSVDVMAKLCSGEWPYSQKSNSVCRWDKDRLNILTNYLGHTNCIPLILAAFKLDQKKFSEIVQLLEKFIFRYKIICNQHIGKASSIYLKHASVINKDKDNFDIGLLKRELQVLLDDRAPDTKFSEEIKLDVKYSAGKSKKNIKYALVSLEEHWRSLQNGDGFPRVLDKTNIFDFDNGTTIEHIYPQNPESDAFQVGCEPIKHSLGNLTLLGDSDNKIVDNLPFGEKKRLLAATNIEMNRAIARDYDLWDSDCIKGRQEDLISKLCQIFRLI